MSPADRTARAAHMADARKKYQEWVARGAPGRLRLRETPGTNICEAVYPAGWAGIRFRLLSLCSVLGAFSLGQAWRRFWYRLAGVRMGANVYISYGVKLDVLAPWMITLGDGCTLGVEAIVAMHMFHQDSLVLRKIHLGQGAVVGARALVFASLGDHAILGPGSALFTDASPGETLLGVPATRIF